MKLTMFLSTAILFINTSYIGAQSYDKLWKEAQEYELKDQPRSAGNVVSKIILKAQKEGNHGQYLSALLHECRLRQAVVSDSFYSDMRMLQHKRDAESDAVLRSVYAYVLADCYTNNKNRNNIYSEDYVAHDDSIHLWPQRKFEEEVKRNIDIAMSDVGLLARTKSGSLVPFVQKGKDAAFFGNDLLNVVGRGVVDMIWGLADEDRKTIYGKYYGMLTDVYRKNENREALLWWRLDSIKRNADYTDWYDGVMTEEERHATMLESDEYKACRQLLDEYRDLPYVLEVYLYMAGNNSYAIDERMKWAKEGLALHGGTPYAAALKNWMAQQTAPAFNLSLPTSVYPEKTFDVSITRKNVSRITVEWYSVAEDVEKKFDRMTVEERISLCRKQGKLAGKEEFSWTVPVDYKDYNETMQVRAPGFGRYYVIVSSPDMKNNSGDIDKVEVTALRTMIQVLSGGKMRFRVVDAMSGKPVANARLKARLLKRGKEVYKTEMTGKDVVYTDNAGLASFDFPKDNETVADISVQKDNDRYCRNITASLYYLDTSRAYAPGEYSTVSMYSDRAIYRPGQTVYVGGIAYGGKGNDVSVLKSADYTLTLKDAYGKDIDRKVVKTDEMGVFSASFTIPQKATVGHWRVAAEYYQSVGFRVEEYKRPSFLVTLDEIKGIYTSGDTISVTGQAMNYNGVPLRNARVTGRSLMQFMFYRMGGGNSGKTINDTIYTDADGKFVIDVPVPEKLPYAGRWGLSMNINVEVLSASGETQTADVSVSLGKSGMLSIDAPVRWERTENKPFTVTLVSGSEHKDEASAVYSVYRSVSAGGEKKELVPVYESLPLKLDEECSMKLTDDMSSGDYVMKVMCVLDGDTIEASHNFILFGRDDRKAPAGYKYWHHVLNGKISSDKPAEIIMGTVDKDVYLYYTLMSRDNVLEDTVYCLSDSAIVFRYDYGKYNFKDGMQAQFVVVKDGVSYVDNTFIEMSETDRKLKFEWETFRDRLEPGSKEKWTLKITDATGKPVKANVMTTMYDASLDQFAAHKWYINLLRPSYVPNYYLNVGMPYSVYYNYMQMPVLEDVRMLEFDRFDIPYMGWTGMNMMTKRMAGAVLQVRENSLDVEEAYLAEAPVMAAAKADAVVEPEVKAAVPVRTNLRETAFFYPALRTDGRGSVDVSFTLPEGLTTWRFMALAHTADMNYGVMEQEVVASKDVMVQLAIPRYIYNEDKSSLSVTVFNKLEKKVGGKLTMEVFDPATDRVLWSETKKLKMDAGSDSVISFSYVPESVSGLMACRVWYDAGRHKDGEQKYLPVLDSSERLTQSKSFVLIGKGETEVDAGELFQNNSSLATERSLTVEYAENPLWYAVLALPSVIDRNAKDALSLANTYYGLKAVGRLAGSYPDITETVSQWNAAETYSAGEPTEKEIAEALMRDASPWWRNFDEYSDASSVLGELFDENNRTYMEGEIMDALAELQYADGSFSWWNGMKGSYGMTCRVALSLARAGVDGNMGGIDVKTMINYLSDTYQQSVDNYKKTHDKDKKDYVPYMWMDYMYIMAQYGNSYLDDNDRKYLDYGIGILSKTGNEIQKRDKPKAMYILWKAGYKKEAGEIATSLKEYLVTDRNGMHLEYPSNGSYSSDMKIEMHVSMMEAFGEAGLMDDVLKRGMAQWLLEQKRVQAWDTPLQTAMAVEALFDCMSSSMNGNHDFVIEVKDGKGNVMETLTDDDARKKGMGYVAVTIDGSKLKNGISVVDIKRSDSVDMAWGCVYAQYKMPVQEVESASSGLAIRNESDVDVVRPGDRVKLRYILTVDKDYEYVALKTPHAACLEPVNKISGVIYKDGISAYREVRDASVSYYIENLPKGYYVFEEEYFVEREGEYVTGVPRLTSIYAPEFTSHARSLKINVEK